MDDVETLAQALRREVHEETGLTVATYERFGTFSDPSRIAGYPDGNIMRVVTLAYRVIPDDISGLRASDESVELRFFARDELPPAALVAPHQPIIERYLVGESGPFLD